MDNFFDSNKIKDQLKEKGITNQLILEQISIFKKGILPVELLKPCTVGDGIQNLFESDINHYIKVYENSINSVHAYKFVPASGAATRMFKDILSEYSNSQDNFDTQSSPNIVKLLENISQFAFFEEIESEIKNNDGKKIVKKILFENGLNYTNLPKGLIKFHKYTDTSRTAFEEHLVEAREYVGDGSGKCNIHFTVPPEFKSEIEEFLEDKLYEYQQEPIKFNLSYSMQNPSSDTITVDPENRPVTDENNNLIFRPGGHGALIENLNSIDSEIIFIKNIDNVTTDKYLPETVKYKKVLAGYLITIHNKIEEILGEIDNANTDIELSDEIIEFCSNELGIELPDQIDPGTIKNLLNKPIRVCGVVKNEGEPGGGPFWINKDGIESKQIVESAQVNTTKEKQKDIWNSSTHFNPVDIVCWIKDYRGNKFNLDNFIDKEACIITIKSSNGKEIKALELPGLWNGAMAEWLTVFVEVPLITFNPVKTVFDLLRKEHRN